MAQAQASRGPVQLLLTPRGQRLPSGAVTLHEGGALDPGLLLKLQILGSYPLKIFSHFIEIGLELLRFPKCGRRHPQEHVTEDWSLNVRSVSMRSGSPMWDEADRGADTSGPVAPAVKPPT